MGRRHPVHPRGMIPTDHDLPAAVASSPTIRLAQMQDVDQLAAVLATGFYDVGGWQQLLCPFIRLGIQADLSQRIKAQSPRYACLAAVFPESCGPTAIAATVEAALRQPWPWNGDRHLYISNLAVDHRFRRQGIATQLLQSCEQLARDWRVSDLRLHVMEDNQAARALYSKAGFTTLQPEDTLASWLGWQARRLLLHKSLTP
jgi:ribosomal protein S18 acetylase RimI-like enzyme